MTTKENSIDRMRLLLGTYEVIHGRIHSNLSCVPTRQGRHHNASWSTRVFVSARETLSKCLYGFHHTTYDFTREWDYGGC